MYFEVTDKYLDIGITVQKCFIRFFTFFNQYHTHISHLHHYRYQKGGCQVFRWEIVPK